MKKIIISFIFLLNQAWAIDCSQNFAGTYSVNNLSFILNISLEQRSLSQLVELSGINIYEFNLNQLENGNYQFRLDHFTEDGEELLSMVDVNDKNAFLAEMANLEKSELSVVNNQNGCQVLVEDGGLFMEIDQTGVMYSWFESDGKRIYDSLFTKIINK